jgi:pimeloyl-ACP methyl ester carboxylesterase
MSNGGPLTLAALESFYVGGTTREVDGGEMFGRDVQVSGAIYVQRLVPTARSFPLPVLFIHGGMHSGVTWETTPDGREGWQTLFVRVGFETLVIDQAWRGRSAPDLTGLNPFANVAEEVGPAHTCGMEMGRRFERGGGRFPMDHLQTYAAQLWPDFFVPEAIGRGLPGLSDPRNQPPLAALLDRVGPVVLVTHSQGGDVGWRLAKAHPDKVHAILAIEPALTKPGLGDEDFPDIPVCVMWGDNLPEEARTLSQRDVALAREVAARRPKVVVDLLPEHGISGNGHMLMMEDNSEALAERAMAWFRSLAITN